MAEKVYQIKGMHCASCASIIEKKLGKQGGVSKISVNFAMEQARIDFDSKLTNIAELSKAISPLGYTIEEIAQTTAESGKSVQSKPQDDKNQEAAQLKNKVRVAMVLVVIAVFIMTWDFLIDPFKVLPEMPEVVENLFHHLLLIMATYSLFVTGSAYLRGIWMFIKHRMANMDTLIGIGTLTAYIYSLTVTIFEDVLRNFINTEYTYYDVTIIVIGLITLGKYLEARSKLKTGDAIKKLIGLQVKTAIVIRDGKELELPVDQVAHDDKILIKPGMKIPVDGVIIEGASYIDESMLTGEPMPAEKKMNDKVAAGTINTTGSFVMKATGVGSETLLAHIIKMVQEAQGSKAPIQRLADQISSVFVPVVLVISVVALAVWLIAGSYYMPFGQALSLGLVCFVSVLVIACPCALGLATPTAIIVGVGKGALHGILIKNAEILEKLHKVTTLITDKTGTLTIGKPQVVSFKTVAGGLASRSGGVSEKDALAILASLEKKSEHPIAESIAAYGHKYGVDFKNVSNFENNPGKGVKGVIDGETYYAGGQAMLFMLSPDKYSRALDEITSKGMTPVALATEKQLIAIVAVGDQIKPEAKAAIKRLHDMGVKVVMATGDHEKASRFIANQVGIDEVMAQVLPQDKLVKVKELQAAGELVAMAGDGVNDAPALAQADVGIAMSTGTDVSIETSDVTVLHGDISKISQAIRLSRLTMRTIKQNLFWAFIYNIVGIPLAGGVLYPVFGWLLSPIIAGVAMAFSSVSVVTNSLTLKVKRL